MSTTRHLINRRRRLAATRPDRDERQRLDPDQDPRKPPLRKPPPPRALRQSRRAIPWVPLLGVLAVLLGGFAVWAGARADALHDGPATRNTALTEAARTSEVKGSVTEAVNAVFSYDHTSPEATEDAAGEVLVGKAVEQHREMLAQVVAQGEKQQLVLTTTVTDSGVEMLDGNRARLLVFADQRNTRTGKGGDTTHAAAMFAVEAVHSDGSWRISDIDTFNR
ncbi:hypothetical protein LHJ74_21290 [Streptomyces sp. N2-109]|uniref:Mce-associated membrane protein n=1 Tax=Streptomyces gossypii TaxID=2883101 RepID=A0ABT2JWY2_9ACTN|nr:hypothetical protein [Streptomyces gossypii]MCT2592408.1 hypothetical protein [Streptomyces gossypii]